LWSVYESFFSLRLQAAHPLATAAKMRRATVRTAHPRSGFDGGPATIFKPEALPALETGIARLTLGRATNPPTGPAEVSKASAIDQMNWIYFLVVRL
jgi:hypothetical protein